MADRRASTLTDWTLGLMGTAALGILGWIALSVAHIPQIDQKLDDFISTAGKTLGEHETRLNDHSVKLTDHEMRIHDLERAKK